MRKIILLSFILGLATMAMGQPMPAKTAQSLGFKGPVKRVSYGTSYELFFDQEGRMTKAGNNAYIYDELGRLIKAGNTHYYYDADGRLLYEQEYVCDTITFDDVATIIEEDTNVEETIIENDTVDVDTNSEEILIDIPYEEPIIFCYIRTIQYIYNKKNVLKSCICTHHYLDSPDNLGYTVVEWTKKYYYDKSGRLIRAEARTPSKELDFSYQVVYDKTADTIEEYVYYSPITDTLELLPLPECFYAVNHGYNGLMSIITSNQRYLNINSDVAEFDSYDMYENGITWTEKYLIAHTEYDEDGDELGTKTDTISHMLHREIDYYGELSVNVSMPEEHVLYRGVENTVYISVDGIPNEYLYFKGEGISLEENYDEEYTPDCLLRRAPEEGKNCYKITPLTDDNDIAISIISTNNNYFVDDFDRYITDIYFRIKSLPVLSFADEKGNPISGNLDIVHNMDRYKGIACEYLRYQTVQVQNGSEILKFECENAMWTPEILEAIKKMQDGDMILINATILVPEGRKFELQGALKIDKSQPVLVVGAHLNNDYITYKELKSNPVLKVIYFDKKGKEVALPVESFTFNVSGTGGLDITHKGSNLTPEMLARIAKASPENKIYIDKAIVRMPDGGTKELSCTLRLK